MSGVPLRLARDNRPPGSGGGEREQESWGCPVLQQRIPRAGTSTAKCARNQHPSLLIKQVLANHRVGQPDALGGSLNFPSQFTIEIGTLHFLRRGILSRAYEG